MGKTGPIAGRESSVGRRASGRLLYEQSGRARVGVPQVTRHADVAGLPRTSNMEGSRMVAGRVAVSH